MAKPIDETPDPSESEPVEETATETPDSGSTPEPQAGSDAGNTPDSGAVEAEPTPLVIDPIPAAPNLAGTVVAIPNIEVDAPAVVDDTPDWAKATPSEVAMAQAVWADPDTEKIDLSKSPYENAQEALSRTRDNIAQTAAGQDMISRMTDPFPNEAWPEGPAARAVVVAPNGGKHGGILRRNSDGSVSFKPTSYIGDVITAPNYEGLSNLVG